MASGEGWSKNQGCALLSERIDIQTGLSYVHRYLFHYTDIACTD